MLGTLPESIPMRITYQLAPYSSDLSALFTLTSSLLPHSHSSVQRAPAQHFSVTALPYIYPVPLHQTNEAAIYLSNILTFGAVMQPLSAYSSDPTNVSLTILLFYLNTFPLLVFVRLDGMHIKKITNGE